MTLLITPPGILAFPHLFVPQEALTPGGKPRFNCHLIFNEKAQKTAEYAALKAAAMEAAKKQHGDKLNDKGFMAKFSWPFRDGEEKASYGGFVKGTKFIAPWSYSRPGVVWSYAGQDGKPAPVELPDDIYPGMLARAQVSFFGYAKSGNYGVGVGLANVQITDRTTPRIDGRQRAEDAFEVLDEAPADFGEDAPI